MGRLLKKAAAAAVAAGLLSLCSCGTAKPGTFIDYAGRDLAGHAKLAVKKDANGHAFKGFGAEWDPFFFMPFNQKYGLTEDDWQLNLNRVKAMNLKTVRTFFTPDYYEPSDGRMDFETNHMKSLKRQLDACEELGITVTLSCHGIPYSSWLGFPAAQWNFWSAPNSLDRFAGNIAALLQYLLVDKGYTCIRYLNLWNEPNITFTMPQSDRNSPWVRGEPEKKYYIEMAKKVDQKLKDEKLRDKIGLVFSDDADDMEFMRDVLTELKEVGDVISSHNYMFTDLTANSKISLWAEGVMNYADTIAPALPHFLYEVGNGNSIDAYHTSDLKEYERGFYLPKIAVNYLNAGGTGMMYWTLFDQLYSDGLIETSKMSYGLWGFKDEEWELRPTYHALALMSRFTEIGAKVYPFISDDDFVCGVGFENPGGSRTYFVYNAQRSERAFYIEDIGGKNGIYNRYDFTRETAALQQDILDASGSEAMSGLIIQGSMAPQSFAVYHMSG